MNDLDEFVEIALAILIGLTLLVWLLTYLERGLVRPSSEERRRAVPADVLAARDETSADDE